MKTLEDLVAVVSFDMNMQPVEDAIKQAMRDGKATKVFMIVDGINDQTGHNIHRMGVELLRKQGYTIASNGPTSVSISGW